MNPTSQPIAPTSRTATPSPRRPQPRATASHTQQRRQAARESRATHRVAASPEPTLGIPHLPADSPTPTSGTAIIKLELQPRTDIELASFGESHVLAMDGNPWFPFPIPSTDFFDARLAAFEAKLAELQIQRTLLINLTQQKDQIRRELEAAFNQRATYIQLASQGNPDAIASTGLTTRRPRTSIGTLPAPNNLVASVTQIPGQILLTWETVPRARSFIIESAPLTDGPPQPWTTLYLGGQLKHLATDLTPGQRYAFRIATIGGKDGRSPWSPVVERMAA